MATASDFYTMPKELSLVPVILHKHRIVPGHMGGIYEKSNVIKLTIAGHARAHLDLFKQHGRWQDCSAYLGLMGLLPHAQIARLANVLAHRGISRGWTEERKIKARALMLGNTYAALHKGRKQTPEWIEHRTVKLRGQKRTSESRMLMSASAKAYRARMNGAQING